MSYLRGKAERARPDNYTATKPITGETISGDAGPAKAGRAAKTTGKCGCERKPEPGAGPNDDLRTHERRHPERASSLSTQLAKQRRTP